MIDEALAKPQVSPGAIGPFNPYGVDIVKRITPGAGCFHPGETWDNPDRG